MKRLGLLLSTTAVRLTLVYTLLFGLIAVGVVAYVSYNTGRLIITQIQSTIDEEVTEIAQLSRAAGIRNLIPMIERRARRPGANLYLISDPRGRIIAGNVKNLDRKLLTKDGWQIPPFEYQRFTESDENSVAIARVFSLPGNLKLLIGRDVRDAERFRQIVRRAMTFSLVAMVISGLVIWFFVGRRALKHIDSMSSSSKRIIEGDLSQRLPVSGTGDEFDRLSTNLNELIARIEMLNSGVVTMSDSIAHDLRTPLSKIRNRAEAALGNSDGHEALEDIIDESDRLIKIFNALLMISQVDSGARTVDLEVQDISQILNDVYELYQPVGEEAGVDIEMTNTNPVLTRCNRELIAQAITNLLDNSIKYGCTAPQPKIALELKIDGQSACIRIRDNGTGVSRADRTRIMERFVRLDESRSQPGSGLGLSLVRAIAKLHEGSFRLKDNNPGLIAEIRLPIAQRMAS